MKNTNFIFISKVFLIALALFFAKHLLQAFIEFTNIIPVSPKAFIWGLTDRAVYFIGWQFVFTFWVYILAVILFYFILKMSYLKRMKKWKIVLVIIISVFIFLMFVHNFEFPIEKTYFPTGKRVNFTFIEELLIYSLVGFLMVSCTRNYLINDDRKN